MGEGDCEAVDKQTHGALAPMWSLMPLVAKGTRVRQQKK